jgi:CRP/FNR family cyclic AMP-dependent transcriptional regulator
MAERILVLTHKSHIWDLLAGLPPSSIVEFNRNEVIYSNEQPSTNLYLVTEGSVKILGLAHGGHPVCLDVYQRDDFFGESAFLGIQHNHEQAKALEKTKLMSWTPAQLEGIADQSPRLAVALLKMVVQRNTDLRERIESFAVEEVPRRLARCLIRFGDHLGTQQTDHSILIMPITHQLLAYYLGSTRELVSRLLGQFRRAGYVRYSRRSITVYPDALRRWLRQSA